MMITFKEFLTESRIGKVIGGDHYVHKDYEHVLPQEDLNKAKSHLPKDFEYTAVKHNKKEGTFAFIHSPDFDSSPEPTVGTSIKVHPSGETKTTKMSNPPKIWHHKHQWVAPDYKGFDVEKSKKRSEDWKKVVDKMKEHDPQVYNRIGSKKFWDDNVVPKL